MDAVVFLHKTNLVSTQLFFDMMMQHSYLIFF